MIRKSSRLVALLLVVCSLLLGTRASTEDDRYVGYEYTEKGLRLSFDISSERKHVDLSFEPLNQSSIEQPLGPYAAVLKDIANSPTRRANIAYCLNLNQKKDNRKKDDQKTNNVPFDADGFAEINLPAIHKEITDADKLNDAHYGGNSVNVFVIDCAYKENYENSVASQCINEGVLKMLRGEYPTLIQTENNRQLAKASTGKWVKTNEVRIAQITEKMNATQDGFIEKAKSLEGFIKKRNISVILIESELKYAFLTKLLPPAEKRLFLKKRDGYSPSGELCIMGLLSSIMMLSGYQIRSETTSSVISGNSFFRFVDETRTKAEVLPPDVLAVVQKNASISTFFPPGYYEGLYGDTSPFVQKVRTSNLEKRRILSDIESKGMENEEGKHICLTLSYKDIGIEEEKQQ